MHWNCSAVTLAVCGKKPRAHRPPPTAHRPPLAPRRRRKRIFDSKAELVISVLLSFINLHMMFVGLSQVRIHTAHAPHMHMMLALS